MIREQLKELVCIKLALEDNEFKHYLLKKSPDEIFNSAYKICSYENMYNFLMTICETCNEEDIIKILKFPDLMEYLYSEWIDYEDSSAEDWESFLRQQISDLSKTEEVYEENSINS